MFYYYNTPTSKGMTGLIKLDKYSSGVTRYQYLISKAEMMKRAREHHKKTGADWKRDSFHWYAIDLCQSIEIKTIKKLQALLTKTKSFQFLGDY